MTIDIAQAL